MKILVAHAIEQEKVNIALKNAEVVQCQTGVGKVNAAMHTYQAILQHQPDLVINMGTAGSVDHKLGDILVCDKFADREIEKVSEPLGMPYIFSFAEELEKYAYLFPDEKRFVCNSGDSFVTERLDTIGDVFDMEAVGIAQVCKLLGVPMVAVKYVSDIIGENSIKGWEEWLIEGNKGLQLFFDEMYKRS